MNFDIWTHFPPLWAKQVICPAKLWHISTLFFNNVTIYGFDFFTEKDGGRTEWQKLDYYREKELDKNGHHEEDVAWKRSTESSSYFTEFINEEATAERKQIIQTLVERNQVSVLT